MQQRRAQENLQHALDDAPRAVATMKAVSNESLVCLAHLQQAMATGDPGALILGSGRSGLVSPGPAVPVS
jgi:hypothetical protein